MNIRKRLPYFTSIREPDENHDEVIIETAVEAPGREVVEHMPSPSKLRTQSSVALADAPTSRKTHGARVPMLANYLFCALPRLTWYFQFFFMGGEVQVFQLETMHMASIIIFGLWASA